MDYKQQQEIIKYLARLEKQLIKVYGDTYKAAIDITDVRKAIESGGTFTWSDNRQAAAKLDKMLRQMTQKVETLIANGIVASYRKGERSVIGEITKALGIRTKTEKADVTAICDAATDQRRAQGQSAAAHINARRGGIQASAQIWQQNAKKEIEIIVQNGMKEGKSPSEIAQSIRSYLKEPYRYEKSVYNPTTGRLERSDAAKDYHPGQGVYRSSYKNALRMARTEMTQAYRQAEWESYQNNPLIKAYEIRLSGNHTTMKTVKGKRVPVPLTDICDKLAGVYPKTFKWVGWHPQCRCLMIPITVSKSEFRELLEARKADREAKQQGKEATAVKKLEQQAANRQLPKQFTKWLEENRQRIETARKADLMLPQWIIDNENIQTTHVPEPITLSSPNAPSTLTPEQLKAWLENELKVAQELGIERGDPMTFEHANEQRGNPHYKKGSGDGYTTNCQSCVVANELRRRGYDVEAWNNTKQKGNIPYELSHKTNWAWIDPETGQMPKKMRLTGRQMLDEQKQLTTDARIAKYQYGNFSTRILYEQLDTATKEPGRYNVDWSWKSSKSGHIITVERLHDGKLRFYDPQTGETTTWKDYRDRISGRFGLYVLRVDNLLVNEKIIKEVVAKAGTTKPIVLSRFEIVASDCYDLFIERSKRVGRPKALQEIKQAFEFVHKKDKFTWNDILDYFLKREMQGVSGSDGGKPITKLPETSKQRRTEIRKLAKPLKQHVFKNPDFPKAITITTRGIKEWTDQPFKFYDEKNEMLLNIEKVIREAKYLGSKADYHNNNCKAHIFETDVHGEKAWIIVREMPNGECHIHSISDNVDVKSGVKKDA